MPSLPQFIADMTMSPGLWLCALSRVISSPNDDMTASYSNKENDCVWYVTIRLFSSVLLGIDLENIVYYKDDTHYFVMTAKKQSLLEKGVILHVSDQSPDLGSVWCVFERRLLSSRHKSYMHAQTDRIRSLSLSCLFVSLSFFHPFSTFILFLFFCPVSA